MSAESERNTSGAPMLDALVLALSTDPVVRWMFPGTARYRAAVEDLVRSAPLDGPGAWSIDAVYGGAGIAIWEPPGSRVDTTTWWGTVVDRHVDPTRQADVLAWCDQLWSHRRAEPHWWLVGLGVDPCWQQQGFGCVLLRRGLQRCDRDGLPCAVAATSPASRASFERRGFGVAALVQVADSPPTWGMIRPPATA